MSKRIAVIVTGDRYANEREWQSAVFEALHALGRNDACPTLIHGGCAGIDEIADGIASRRPWNILPMDYIDELGKAGGPARNREMANVGKALQRCGYDVRCYAFHDDLEHSKGTRNMVETAQRAGIPVWHFTSDGKVREA